ncbi:MAG: DUF72 domain-containing protein [Bacillaceae bacterium]|nr:DUF72 domain-containing protein [Bacillaceae bacterium]
MITIGLTGWGDHDELYLDGTPNRDKLRVYSSHFPVVELDASFYAIQPQRNYEKWVDETPDSFSFVVKAYQGMTGHSRGKIPFDSIGEMFERFKESVRPLMDADKLKAVLFQYPPWFDCTRKNVELLKYTKSKMDGIPSALEFRNRTWFSKSWRDKTLQFMEKEGWIHSVCDEPQVGEGSVPTVLHPTHPDLTIVRMHGRNEKGWVNTGQPDWRDVRYLYRYSEQELKEWAEKIRELARGSKEVCVLFNNNSGGDAARNGKELISLLGIEYENLAPRQLDLF